MDNQRKKQIQNDLIYIVVLFLALTALIFAELEQALYLAIFMLCSLSYYAGKYASERERGES